MSCCCGNVAIVDTAVGSAAECGYAIVCNVAVMCIFVVGAAGCGSVVVTAIVGAAVRYFWDKRPGEPGIP